jgi:hypothetical protein
VLKIIFLILTIFSSNRSFSQIPKGATINLLCNYKYDRSLSEWKKIDNCFKVNYEVTFQDKEIDVYDGATGVVNQILTNKKSPITIRKGYIYYKGLKDIMRENSMVDVLISFEKIGNYYIDFTYLELDFRIRVYITDLYFYK